MKRASARLVSAGGNAVYDVIWQVQDVVLGDLLPLVNDLEGNLGRHALPVAPVEHRDLRSAHSVRVLAHSVNGVPQTRDGARKEILLQFREL